MDRVFKSLDVLFPFKSPEREVAVLSWDQMDASAKWHALVGAARAAEEKTGSSMTRLPGRGLSNMFRLERDGKTHIASVRTTNDRWFAFNPKEGGGWKTLDDVEVVLVAAVDDPHSPQNIEVYRFPASEVRERFDASLHARLAAGWVKKDYAMWLALDEQKSDTPSAVGSGLAGKYKPIAVFPIGDMGDEPAAGEVDPEPPPSPEEQHAVPTTIAAVLQGARERIAELAGVPVELVRLELKLELQ